jgi:FkbM family methyltransferase
MSSRERLHSYTAFGQALEVDTGAEDFLKTDSLWRLNTIYQPFLARHSLPKTGVAVDIGAGFGVFALPFAQSYPGWTVWCFEPQEDAFKLLTENVERLGLSNVICVQLAIADSAPNLPEKLNAALKPLNAQAVCAQAQNREYWRDRSLKSFLRADRPNRSLGFQKRTLPSVTTNILAGIAPDFVKFTCPGLEQDVLKTCAEIGVSFIAGETRKLLKSKVVPGFQTGECKHAVHVSGSDLALLSQGGADVPAASVDVVVAMYNAETFIEDCVEGLIGANCPDVRVLVVDDGSTDGSAERVQKLYGKHPNVTLLQKPNGGCASARNYGRLHSTSSHIGFVDADDYTDQEFFPELLELALWARSEIVQGAFDLVFDEVSGPSFEDSHEIGEFAPIAGVESSSFRTFSLHGLDLLARQPTIWRRIYRRDFLDHRDIWFPEHIRAFDDQYFHMLTLYHGGLVHCLDHVRYHYRQHPAQDIRQGDERMFYSLEMYRMVLRRAIKEAWPDLSRILESYRATVDWTNTVLRDDLRPRFNAAAGELWVMYHLVMGAEARSPGRLDSFKCTDFAAAVDVAAERYHGLAPSFAWGFLDAMDMHPNMVRQKSRS